MTSPDSSQLPHLLALLDDRSIMVRDSVLGKLSEFGPGLEQALQRLPDPPSELQTQQLFASLDQYQAKVREFYRAGSEGTVMGSALFRPGDLVRHRRYGYLGLVVDWDLNCNANQEWYTRNRTQPERHQPWYHVLVDASDAVTYAAQTSLLPDESKEEIRHALVAQFFERCDDGRYLRNKHPWPRMM